MTNPDMPGLEEALDAMVANTMERNHYREGEIPYMRHEFWRLLHEAAYPIIERAVREKVARESGAAPGKAYAMGFQAGLDEAINRLKNARIDFRGNGPTLTPEEAERIIRGTATEGERDD